MSGRKSFLFVALLTATSLTTSNTQAQPPLAGVDGCAILAMLVYTEVTETGRHGVRVPGDPAYPGPDEITICNQTSRSVTGAFTASLRQMNIYVSWGHRTGFSGDHCLSHYLSQCYPDRNPYMPALSASDRIFIATSWSAISGAVNGAMAASPGSDVSRFDPARLRRSMQSRLAMYRVAGELADAER